jgi:hypothetical protein
MREGLNARPVTSSNTSTCILVFSGREDGMTTSKSTSAFCGEALMGTRLQLDKTTEEKKVERIRSRRFLCIAPRFQNECLEIND